MSTLKDLIQDTSYADAFSDVEIITDHGFAYDDLFKATFKNEKVVLKIRKNSSWNIIESNKNILSIIDKDNYIVKHDEVFQNNDKLIIIRKYIEGNTLDKSEINHTIEAFRKLAKFNLNNKTTNNLTSMYLDGKSFKSVEEFIEYESKYYLETYQGKHDKSNLKKTLEYLKEGFGCIIIEDMNNGNTIVQSYTDNQYVIDYDYLIPGINIYQFEFLDPYKFQENKWYNIQENADLVFKAYFEELNTTKSSANNQINGFQILEQLRSIYFLQWKKEKVNYSIFDKNIDIILSNKILS